MTGVYSQLFLDSFGNLPPIVRALAAAADDMEMKLERLRIHCGFHDDWSPHYDRTTKSAAHTAIKWADKCGAVNGMGDLHALIQEMCGWMDTVGEKIADAEQYIVARRLVGVDEGLDYMFVSPAMLDAVKAAPEPAKRGPGRPRKDAA